jgi:hypothetical protein
MLELVIEEVRFPFLSLPPLSYTSYPFYTPTFPFSLAVLTDIQNQAGTRFSEEELNDILEIIQGVFDEDEAQIPAGVEDMQMEKIANKLLGASKKKRKVKRKV